MRITNGYIEKKQNLILKMKITRKIKCFYTESKNILGHHQMWIKIRREYNSNKVSKFNNNSIVFNNLDDDISLNPRAHPIFIST